MGADDCDQVWLINQKTKFMKNLMTVALLLAASSAWAQGQLEVVVKNVKEEKGAIRVGIFRDDKTFMKDAWLGKVVKATTGEVKVVFENVPAGTYAVSIVHDSNENGELDSNAFGIPKEGFGFSNDAMGMFGPPSFQKASVAVGAGSQAISITLRYM